MNDDFLVDKQLVIKDVCHFFGQTQILDDISLTVGQGKIVCLLGPSGCGKTTLLRLVAGLETLRTGTIHWNHQLWSSPIQHRPPEQRRVGFLFQDYALFPHLTVLENVAFGIAQPSKQERKNHAVHWLNEVGLSNKAQYYPHTLSGGQQQRVALARALACNPSVVLLDEPFSALDITLRDQMRDMTLHLLKKQNACTLMVTHDPEEAMFMADRIAIMKDGAIVQQGSPHELYRHPQDPFVASFMGDINRIPGIIQDGKAVTPLGEFPAHGFANWTQVWVYVRPEDLQLIPHNDGCNGVVGIVITSHMLGRTSMVHMRVPMVPEFSHQWGDDLHLHAHQTGSFLPDEGRKFVLQFNPQLANIFPQEHHHHDDN